MSRKIERVELFLPSDGSAFLTRGRRPGAFLIDCSHTLSIAFLIPAPDTFLLHAIRMQTEPKVTTTDMVNVALVRGSVAEVLMVRSMDANGSTVFTKPVLIDHNTYMRLDLTLLPNAGHGRLTVVPSLVGDHGGYLFERLPELEV